MLMRQILTFCLLFAVCGAASAQVDSPLDAFNSLKAQEEGSPEDAPRNFDILDLPDDLFNRRRPSRPPVKLPPLELDQEWDYRFDVQFQSTIKPYMRWYMRQNPRTPRQRYLTDEYKAGYHGFYASAEGYSAYSLPKDSYGQPMSPYYQGQFGSVRYWDHLNWLYHQYKTTPIDRSFKTTGRPLQEPSAPIELDSDSEDGIDPVLPDLFSESRPAVMKELRRQSIWVCRHQTTGQICILYVKPSAQSEAMFYEAQAAMTGGNSILALKWKTQPAWADKVVLKAGRLKNVEASDGQVASTK